MEDEKFLLQQLIFYKENDLASDLGSGYRDEQDKDNLVGLILSLTRYIHDFRYCSRKNCPCSPEFGIKVYYDETKHFLQGTNTALTPVPWKTIEEILGGI